jgi:hypothetical protein
VLCLRVCVLVFAKDIYVVAKDYAPEPSQRVWRGLFQEVKSPESRVGVETPLLILTYAEYATAGQRRFA